MMTKPAKVALALFVGIPLLLVILAAQRNHGHLMFTVKVQGQLFLPDRNSRRPRALVMVMPDRRWATDANLMRLVREEARDREEQPQSIARSASEIRYAPMGASGATVNEDEEFTIHVAVRWTVSYLGPIRLTGTTPPPRYDLGVLRIEIEGRAPVILDVPEGTWTEHGGEDGLWATWDLGVVEVPSTP